MLLDFLYQHVEQRKAWSYRRMRNTAAVVADVGGANGTTSGTDGTAASSTASGTTASTTGTAATSAASSTAATGDSIQEGDWRTLRTKYDAATKRTAVLDSLGIPEAELGTVAKTWTALQTEALSLAKELGYDDEADNLTAFQQDPVGIMTALRKEKQEAAARSTTTQRQGESQADFETRVRDEVAKQTKPFTEHLNKQHSDAVTAKIGTEFETAFTATLPHAPAEIKSIVQDYVAEAIAHNPAALKAMKVDGNYAQVADIVKLVAGRLTEGFKAWNAAEAKRTGQRTTTPGLQSPGTGTGRPTLDQMIENPGLINAKYS